MRQISLKSRCGVLGFALLSGLDLAAGSASPSTASAEDSLRCDTKLVSTGAAPYEVRSVCGNPDDIQARTESRTIRRAVDVPCARGYCSTFIEDTVVVNVEEWTYDFGTQRFLQYLTFEQGKLVRIRAGKYGKKQL